MSTIWYDRIWFKVIWRLQVPKKLIAAEVMSLSPEDYSRHATCRNRRGAWDVYEITGTLWNAKPDEPANVLSLVFITTSNLTGCTVSIKTGCLVLSKHVVFFFIPFTSVEDVPKITMDYMWFVSRFGEIWWRVPEIGVPQNYPFYWDIPWQL